MEQSLNLSQRAEYNLRAKRGVFASLALKGLWTVEHWRANRLLDTYLIKNDITNEGKNDILNVYFNGGTQTLAASWFGGLIDNAGLTGVAPTDVMNAHGGWAEFTGYSQATRPAWGPGAASGQSITNGTAMVFNINVSTGTIYGLFMTTVATKGGNTGKLWATAGYSGTVGVINGDEIRSTYTLSC